MSRHSLRVEQDELRARMRAVGMSHDEIAIEFARRYKLRPRAAHRIAHGWTQQQAANHINTHATRTGLDPDGAAPMTAPKLSELENWPLPNNRRRPTPQLLALLAEVYDTSVQNLVDLDDREQLTPADHLILSQTGQFQPISPRIPLTPSHRGPVKLSGPPARTVRPDGIEHLSIPYVPVEMERVMSAAKESGEHAMFAAAGSLDESSVEQLADDVRRLAHTYNTTPPFQMFTELAKTRNTVYALLEQTKRPRQLNELYVFAGQVCGLLGIVSLDLGFPDAGVENARAAWAYGQIVDDDGLRSWARAVQATIAFWSDRPREGIRLTATGLDHARAGSGTVRLHAVQARSYAMIGAADEAMTALVAAQRAAEADASDDLLDSVGGEFSFGEERRLLSAAATHLALSQLDQAAHAASQAIDLFTAIPIADRWTPGEHGARIDLVVARTLGGDLDSAHDALVPVLALPSEQRTGRLTGRLHRLRRSLSQPRYRGSAEAEDLDDQIEHFVRESATAMLPPGTSHQALLAGGGL
ncbi:hypothetical protein CcI6DRAFT_04256 [Frankia sp. CcI6]|uniref:helix-turn-helix domain-containing protein n=1 Tax=Frankia TaxID=1854 RepID=UPI0003CFF396|nr:MULTISPECIES: helix-turn-helix transcriptional regulator [Frankia]ETA00315.1 hypothetical protein CcI6DRAFT_04256 [Frankia sp. CcI6]KFB04523.1 hypothetical protein ALLO2DRAFT_02640 [Frankia sp. Allo2]OAA19539.1 hypothetical protein AAY23_110610 [Frankia casuarinae]